MERGTLIRTARGLVPIEEIVDGDTICAARGNYVTAAAKPLGVVPMTSVDTMLGIHYYSQAHLVETNEAMWFGPSSIVAHRGVPQEIDKFQGDGKLMIDTEIAWFFGLCHAFLDMRVFRVPRAAPGGMKIFMMLVSQEKPNLVARFERVLGRLGVKDGDFKTHEDPNGKGISLCVNPASFSDYMDRMCPEVLRLIFSTKGNIRGAYLAGFLDDINYKDDLHFMVVSLTPRLPEQLQAVFASLAIPTYLYEFEYSNSRGMTRTHHSLSLVGSDSLADFNSRVNSYRAEFDSPLPWGEGHTQLVPMKKHPVDCEYAAEAYTIDGEFIAGAGFIFKTRPTAVVTYT